MLQLRVSTTEALSGAVVQSLESDPAVSSLAVLRGASVRPQGDLIMADVAREGANQVVDRLRELGVHHYGTIHLEPVHTWLSRRGFEAEQSTPGSSGDAVVWAEVTQRAYEDSELNWTYMTFMTLATVIASIAIVLDSQVLVIGAMVLGPEFIPIAALGLALVRRRRSLFDRAARTLSSASRCRSSRPPCRSRRPRDRLGRARRRRRPASPDRLHLHARQVVVHRRHRRRGGGRAVADVGEGRRAVRGVHLGHHRAGVGNVALGLAFGAWHEVVG